MMFSYVCYCQIRLNKNQFTIPNNKVEQNKMKKTEAEWKRILSPNEYKILREKGTERAFTGKYDGHFEDGTYLCTGCDNSLFKSETKYRSGCGWPAFYDVIPESVEEVEDRLQHITESITVSIIGCVVNGPGEAKETDIGLTGGGRGTHQIYISGMADHRLSNGDIVEHVVDLVETRVAEINAAEAAEDISEKAS